MTEDDKEVYQNGVAYLEEWEDVNYCEHDFKFKDEWLTDKEVVDLLNELYEETQKCKEYNSKLYSNHVETCRRLVKQISELEKENEHLKHMIQEAYETERTQLGQSVLKQLMEAIK